MKMILLPVPDAAEITDDMIGDLTSACETTGLASHVVELPDVFELREKLDDPINGATLAIANLSLFPVALQAFTDALAKDRDLARSQS